MPRGRSIVAPPTLDDRSFRYCHSGPAWFPIDHSRKPDDGTVISVDNRLSSFVSNPPDAEDHSKARVVPMTRLQRTVARRMAAATSEIPAFGIDVEIDMTAIVQLRSELKQEERFAPSYNDFVVKACALALRSVPQLNASLADDAFMLHDRINIGVAVAAKGMLVVPTVFDADRLSVEQISRAIAVLAAKVREGSIAPADLAGATFTVSNLGMYGVQRFTAVVNPPQAGILAIGAVEERVVAHEGRQAIRPRMTVSLTADHRLVYGADSAEFLAALRDVLESSEGLNWR
jgi:pyruvate dehydrogenase E2 component (dihydrolipoyllysine-residue acetyltransferase)